MRDSEPQPPPPPNPPPQPLAARALALIALLALLVAGAFSSWAILADRADFDATLGGVVRHAGADPVYDADTPRSGKPAAR